MQYLPVIFIFIACNVNAVSFPCPAKVDQNIAAAPKEIYSFQAYHDNRTTDISIMVAPTVNGMPLHSLIVRRTVGGKIVFAISAALHDYDNRKRTHVIAVPTEEFPQYGLPRLY